MQSAQATFTYITEQEYLTQENQADQRHEYVDGKIYQMAGSSIRHNTIALNLAFALKTRNSNPNCKVYVSDIKVRISSRKSYYYPDVLVSCNENDNVDDHYLEQPCLIIEVLSKSTASKDYLEKSIAYQSIPSLQTYLLVAQDQVKVDMLYRKDNGSWWVSSFEQLDDKLILPCPNVTLSLHDIYDGLSY